MRLFPSAPAGAVRRTARFRAGGAVGLAVLVLLGLGGCAPDNTPKEYGAEVEKSFIQFCTGDIVPVDGVTTTIASNAFCTCAYGVFRDNVPYNDDARKNFGGRYPDDKPTFLALNNDLQNDAGKFDQLPDDIKNRVRNCKTQENVTPGSVPTGTTPSTAPGTTVASTTSGSTPA